MKSFALVLFAAVAALGAKGVDLHSKLFVPIAEKTPPPGTEMTFVKDGKANFVIVVDKDAEMRAKPNEAQKSIGPAAKILQREFELCFGVKVPIVDEGELVEKRWRKEVEGEGRKEVKVEGEGEGEAKYWLVVGDSKLAREQGVDWRKIPDQGFVVKSFDRGLVIVGSDSSLVEGYNARTRLDKRGSSLGTRYGAIDFVNRFLGVAYFFPGPYGTYRPKSRELTIPPVHYEDAPYFNSRGQAYYYGVTMAGKNRARWEALMGKIGADELAYEYWRMGATNPTGGSHTPDPMFLMKEHPDKLKTIFYTGPNGKFWYHPTSYMGNYYNVVDLKFADLLVEDYARVIESDGAWNFGNKRPIGGRKTLQFGVTDVTMTPPDMKDDPVVKELGLMTDADVALGSDRAFANVYGRFHQYLARRVKERWPDAKLWLMPYYNCYYASTDPKWKLPDNVEINFCARDFPLYMRDKKRMTKSIGMLRDWYAALGNRPAQHLWLYNSRDNLSARAVACEFIGDIPKVCGKYLGREGGMFFDYDGPNDLWNHYYSSYVGVQSQWNPDFDVDAAIDAHWDLFYGPKAGPHLKRFHRVLKECFLKHFLTSDEFYPQYPIARIDEMEECLKKAEAALEPGSVEMKRFRVVSEPWAAEFEKRRILASYKPVVYEAKRVAAGTATDAAFWAKLPCVKLFSPKNMSVAPKRRHDVKIAWDDKNVYVHLETFFKPWENPAKNIWDNDRFEAFLAPGLGKEIVYQVASDPNGDEWTQSDRLLPVPQPSDRTWRPKDLKIAAKKSDGGWTCDFTIPFGGMECEVPVAGSEWNFNVVSSAYEGERDIVGSALTMFVHRNVLMYGILRFGE